MAANYFVLRANQNMYTIDIMDQREREDNGLFITLVPKVFLFAGLTTLETIVNFDCLNH